MVCHWAADSCSEVGGVAEVIRMNVRVQDQREVVHADACGGAAGLDSRGVATRAGIDEDGPVADDQIGVRHAQTKAMDDTHELALTSMLCRT
jgi:hypothetical protein